MRRRWGTRRRKWGGACTKAHLPNILQEHGGGVAIRGSVREIASCFGPVAHGLVCRVERAVN